MEREHQEAQEEIRREAERRAQEEQERFERQQREERERYEEEMRQAREESERRETAAREEMQQRAYERAEQERLRHEQETQRLEEELMAKLAAQAAETERMLQEQERRREELQRKQAELQSKYMAGIQPEVWPTPEERKKAEEQLLQPKEEYFHCAIAGLAGSGKSSLINAFRGLRSGSRRLNPAVAPTGVTETTMKITAYRDPSTEPPRSRFVWYDVPGAGTLKIKGWQYFNSQGLFVFDLIIVVVDNRFSEQDLIILQHCERYKIPSFIVRSKANQHILNTMSQDYEWEGSDDERDFDEIYLKAREDVISQTRASYRENLRAGGLDPDKPVYIVSCDGLAALVRGERMRLKGANQLIDEPQIVLRCLEAVKARRF